MKTIEGKKYTCPKCGCGGNDLLEENSIDCHFCGVIDLRLGGAYQDGFEAGQKSREKEIVEKIKNSKTPEKLIKEQYECYDFDEAEVYALENEIIENIIKSLSLTKESKWN